ncbi:sodium/potassium-transporting ATPase subunit beta-1-like [Apostichopus japonicus]|uniref:sodium/potassium-transporting ATPase subunit beta-1-like n=1 Tax=Stichopus japonicus TaxID=307972 RepID=UPI003AB217EC
MGGEDELTFGQKAGLKWAGFKKFMYNKEAGTVMGRNGKAWAQLLGFYTIFYLCLAAFWAAMLAVFLQTIDSSRPTWNSYVSTPVAAFAPAFKYEQIKYTLPWDKDSKEAKAITGPLQKIWDDLDPEKQTDLQSCPDTPNEGDKQRFCKYDRTQLGENCKPPHFGYDKGMPCIYVNLNKVWGWIPEPYSGEENATHIAFECGGEDADDDKVLESYTLYPAAGISFGHYPYKVGTDKEEQARFINPIVAVQFSFELDKKIRITCTPLAGNLKPQPGIYNSDAPVDFTVEFFIDSEK